MTQTKSSRGRKASAVVAAVRPIAESVCASEGLVLWDVAFVKEAGRDTLRVACDRRGGIVSDELALVSERLSRELDHADAIPGERSYILEVTSPGAERPLRTREEFDVCTGREAHVVTRDGRTVDGRIESISDNAVQIAGTRVLLDDISKARLVVEF